MTGSRAQPLETATRCFSRVAAAPLSSDFVPSATPSFRVLARPPRSVPPRRSAMQHPEKGSAFHRARLQGDRVGIASPPFSASPPTQFRPGFFRSRQSSDIAVLEGCDEGRAVRVISSRPSEP